MNDAIEIIAEVERMGIRLRRCGDRIQCKPTGRLTNELRERMRKHKGDLLGLLAGPGIWAQAAAAILATVADDDQRADLRYLFEERAGICEYEGNLSRVDAERIGYECLLRAMTEAGILAGGGSGERVA